MTKLFINTPSFRVSPDVMLTGGTTAFIYDLNTIIKVPKPDQLELHNIECDIFVRLGRHPRIVDAYYVSRGKQNLLVLEKMQMSLRTFLRRPMSRPLSNDTILSFAEQLAEAYRFIHSKNVLHVDIGAHNVLINQSSTGLKLCDFAGSSLDGSEPRVYPSARAQHPQNSGPSMRTELFAFGSLLYELSTGFQPYHEHQEHVVEAYFLKNEFPNTCHLILGPVIMKCWSGHYNDMQDILNQIQDIRSTHEHFQSSSASSQRKITCGGLLISAAACVWLLARTVTKQHGWANDLVKHSLNWGGQK